MPLAVIDDKINVHARGAIHSNAEEGVRQRLIGAMILFLQGISECKPLVGPAIF
jgi:hypothetical protein